ncbi:MAG: GDP-L-fucose synthase [Propionibacteriaceae bacterium]|nr:GDP-L-fucose synthase [Propionibacteriaceae bacterium]
MPDFPLDRTAPVYVAGHRGLVGSAVYRHLADQGFTNLIGRTSAELDLRDRGQVFEFFEQNRPEVVVLAAAKVGGILANNTYPHDFLSENLQIQVNVLDAALAQRVPRLVFLGSSCIYPKFAAQPITEDSLLTGKLEPTNDAYAIAKIAGITQVQATRRQYDLAWISAMPTNLYGPGDNFSREGSHVLPAMIRRFDEARAAGVESVTNWGTGTVRREFLHVDDMASAVLHLLEHFDGPQQVNVGTGTDVTIRELSDMVAAATGYAGTVEWDTSKPDGTPRKLLDVSTLLDSGWTPRISLADGIASTVEWYRANLQDIRA